MADKKGGKNRKYGRMEKWCAVYESSGREDRNRKRKMQRHLRRNPGDKQSITRYEKQYGKAADIGLTSRGRQLSERYQAAGSLL